MEQSKVLERFLSGMSYIYLLAFSSLYVQLPGLYGDRGILPIHLAIVKEPVQSLEEFFNTQPTLIRFAPRLGLSYELCADLVAVVGCAVAMAACVFKSARNSATFAVLWLLYQSLFQLGQTFLWFQWDILLLEAGFLCIGLAFRLPGKGDWLSGVGLRVFAIKWLLFRLMFASGVVKLTSGCPTWWGLTALSWHYESQCLPTPLAWYAHQLPDWFQRLCVAGTFVIEIGVPFLFFLPARPVRKFCFCSQVLLQAAIIATGNYNFFNLLTLLLCLSLLNDDDFGKRRWSGYLLGSRTVEFLVSIGVLSSFLLVSARIFNLSLGPGFTVRTSIGFTEEDLERFNRNGLVLSVFLGAAYLLWQILVAVLRSPPGNASLLKRLSALLEVGSVSVFVICIFTASLVPHSVTDNSLKARLPPSVRNLHSRLARFEIVNSYGLFRRMTGVGGRPELVLQGTEDPDRLAWVEYAFAYKPGSVSRAPPVVAPHQPRLDWQMWFAALGNYQSNPWLLNLVHRLLQSEPTVLQLLQSDPFAGRRPLYVRAQLYTYRYTGWGGVDWWRRESTSTEYLPAVSLDSRGLRQYVEQQRLDEKPPMVKATTAARALAAWLRALRARVGASSSHFSAVLTLLLATLVAARLLGRG